MAVGMGMMRKLAFGIGATVGALMLSGVGQSVAQQAATPSPQAQRPGAYGFSQEGLAGIQDLMETAIRDGRIPSGIAMVARDDEIVWLGTAGEMGPGVYMREDAIVPLASVGKMYTAVAAMILVERGAISLDDPVSKYIPEFADVMVEVADESGALRLVAPETPVTIHHLLTHTGGLRMSGDAFWAAWNAHVGRTTTTDMARALAALPLESQPGAKFSYGATGASYEALGAVIEIAGDRTLEAFMIENIFEPLGLHDTHFYLPDEKSERMPAFYRKVDGALKPDRAYGEDFPRSTYFNGGGGVESSPQDILRFAQIFLNDGTVDDVRILKPETVRLMMSDHLGERAPPGGEDISWGLGAAVQRGADRSAPGRYGWVGGNYAVFWVDRPARLVAYFAFPIMPPGDGALLNDFRRLVYTAMAAPDAKR